MIDLGTTNFFIGIPSMPQAEFESYSTRLFDEWEEHVDRTLALPDYSLVLKVEEGSIKGGGTIAAVLTALYFGIGNYGDFYSGLQTIRSQLNSIGDFLGKQATIPFDSANCEKKIQKRSGSLSDLNRLFQKVQRRELTSEQAMIEVEALFGEEAATVPEFMQELRASFEQTPLFPQQLLLPLDTQEQEALQSGNEKERRRRPSRPLPHLPPTQQFRVEVWRESKRGQREVRVIQL